MPRLLQCTTIALLARSGRGLKDVENVVRILLDHLGQPEIAVKAVKESGSVEGLRSIVHLACAVRE